MLADININLYLDLEIVLEGNSQRKPFHPITDLLHKKYKY